MQFYATSLSHMTSDLPGCSGPFFHLVLKPLEIKRHMNDTTLAHEKPARSWTAAERSPIQIGQTLGWRCTLSSLSNDKPPPVREGEDGANS